MQNLNQRYFVCSTLIGMLTLSATAQSVVEDLKLESPSGVAGGQFGFAVATDSGIVGVGSPFGEHDGVGSGGDASL